MTGEPMVVVIGNLTADPELRFTPSGAAVANFTVAQTPRHFDRQTNEWKDDETIFMRCSIWRDAAENVAESLHRGTRVIAYGKLKQRSYDTREGEKRTVLELEVDEIGPSLRYASAKVTKAERQGQQGGQQQGGWGQQSSGQQQPDPWATPPQGQQGPPQGRPATQGGRPQQPPQQGGWGQGAPSYDEPPFAFPPNTLVI